MLGRADANFWLSGLKTAVRNEASRINPLEPQDISDLCASFQAAVLESTADRLSVGLKLFHEQFGPPRALVAAGGVAANQAIRGALQEVAATAQTTLIIPPPALCTDNGAMIAWAGAERLAIGLTDAMDAAPRARWLRDAIAALATHLAATKPVIACAKGIERGTHKFMTEVIAETAISAIPAILSGPSFAEDVARGLPTAVTLAAKDETLARALVQALGSSTFRPYHTTDVRGVEIGPAAKNGLARAARIEVGRKLGASPPPPLATPASSELT